MEDAVRWRELSDLDANALDRNRVSAVVPMLSRWGLKRYPVSPVAPLWRGAIRFVWRPSMSVLPM